MSISKEQVVKVASLARLDILEADLDRLTDELGNILDYVQRLETVQTEGIEPLTHPIDQNKLSALREDQLQESAEINIFRDRFLDLAPITEGKFFKVPKMRNR